MSLIEIMVFWMFFWQLVLTAWMYFKPKEVNPVYNHESTISEYELFSMIERQLKYDPASIKPIIKAINEWQVVGSRRIADDADSLNGE